MVFQTQQLIAIYDDAGVARLDQSSTASVSFPANAIISSFCSDLTMSQQ